MIYISGGITGVADYVWHFVDGERKLKEMGYKKIISPAKISNAFLHYPTANT